jgi:hypothetical protein
MPAPGRNLRELSDRISSSNLFAHIHVAIDTHRDTVNVVGILWRTTGQSEEEP